MPSLKDIRKRITSVKSTQKITRAMKMVAGARLNHQRHTVVVHQKIWGCTSGVRIRAPTRAQDSTCFLFRSPK